MPTYSRARVAVGISVRVAPPELPIYEQPLCPAEGYIWTPGYWAWGEGDYYWVPGTWFLAPEVGFFWTPGYWGAVVGFYGGINYGAIAATMRRHQIQPPPRRESKGIAYFIFGR